MSSQERKEIDDLQTKLVELAFEFWLEEKMTRNKKEV